MVPTVPHFYGINVENGEPLSFSLDSQNKRAWLHVDPRKHLVFRHPLSSLRHPHQPLPWIEQIGETRPEPAGPSFLLLSRIVQPRWVVRGDDELVILVRGPERLARHT